MERRDFLLKGALGLAGGAGVGLGFLPALSGASTLPLPQVYWRRLFQGLAEEVLVPEFVARDLRVGDQVRVERLRDRLPLGAATVVKKQIVRGEDIGQILSSARAQEFESDFKCFYPGENLQSVAALTLEISSLACIPPRATMSTVLEYYHPSADVVSATDLRISGLDHFAAILDVRSNEAFAAGHLANARNAEYRMQAPMPSRRPGELSSQLEWRPHQVLTADDGFSVADLPKRQSILVYGEDYRDARAHRALTRLAAAGCSRLVWLWEGYRQWSAPYDIHFGIPSAWRIDASRVRSMARSGANIIDLRDADCVQRLGTIAGARHIPVSKSQIEFLAQDAVVEVIAQLRRPTIVYGYSMQDRRAANLARALRVAGREAYWYQAGYGDWLNHFSVAPQNFQVSGFADVSLRNWLLNS